jgi:hypothetical protein
MPGAPRRARAPARAPPARRTCGTYGDPGGSPSADAPIAPPTCPLVPRRWPAACGGKRRGGVPRAARAEGAAAPAGPAARRPAARRRLRTPGPAARRAAGTGMRRGAVPGAPAGGMTAMGPARAVAKDKWRAQLCSRAGALPRGRGFGRERGWGAGRWERGWRERVWRRSRWRAIRRGGRAGGGGACGTARPGVARRGAAPGSPPPRRRPGISKRAGGPKRRSSACTPAGAARGREGRLCGRGGAARPCRHAPKTRPRLTGPRRTLAGPWGAQPRPTAPAASGARGGGALAKQGARVEPAGRGPGGGGHTCRVPPCRVTPPPQPVHFRGYRALEHTPWPPISRPHGAPAPGAARRGLPTRSLSVTNARDAGTNPHSPSPRPI